MGIGSMMLMMVLVTALAAPAYASRTVQQNATNQTTTTVTGVYCPSCAFIGSYACYSTLHNTCTAPFQGKCSGPSTFYCTTGKPNTTSTTTTSISTTTENTSSTTSIPYCTDGYICGIPSDGCAVPGAVYNCPFEPANTVTTTRSTTSRSTSIYTTVPATTTIESCAWWNIFCWLGL